MSCNSGTRTATPSVTSAAALPDVTAGHYALVGPQLEGQAPSRRQAHQQPLPLAGRLGPHRCPGSRRRQECQRHSGPVASHAAEPIRQIEGAIRSRTQNSPSSALPITKPADLPDEIEFYYKLARALKYTPPKPVQDGVVADSLSQIGFKNGNTEFDYKSLSEAQIRGLCESLPVRAACDGRDRTDHGHGRKRLAVESEVRGDGHRLPVSGQRGPSGSQAATPLSRPSTWMEGRTTKASHSTARRNTSCVSRRGCCPASARSGHCRCSAFLTGRSSRIRSSDTRLEVARPASRPQQMDR